MCCCGKPTINGQKGQYSWQGDVFTTYPVNPPELKEGEQLLFDGPGRCGRGTDSHCHHFRLTKQDGTCYLLVRHGGGDERIELGGKEGVKIILDLPSDDDRYWLLKTFHSSMKREVRHALEVNNAMWQQAAADKRIKTRKNRGQNKVKVWIESAAAGYQPR